MNTKQKRKQQAKGNKTEKESLIPCLSLDPPLHMLQRCLRGQTEWHPPRHIKLNNNRNNRKKQQWVTWWRKEQEKGRVGG